MKQSKDIRKVQALIIQAFSEEVLSKIPDHEAIEFRRYKLIPQELLVNAPWNYKDDDEKQQEVLENNIKNQGQTENINVRPLDTGYYQVGNGNHRNKVFEKQGRQFVLCCVHDDISESEFKRRCIEQNETKFGVDQIKLAGLIKEISGDIDIDLLSETMPFDKEDLLDYIKLTEYDWAQFDKADDPALGQGEGSGASAGEGGDNAYQSVILSVPSETYNLWLKWLDRCSDFLDYDSPAKAFEFAIAEAMNIPEESLNT